MRPAAVVRNRKELEALPPGAREARARAFEALSEARLRGLSLSQAARGAGTTVATVLRYAAPAVRRLPNGRYQVLATDRLYRRIQIVSIDGVLIVDTHSSRQAALASAHANAIQRYGLTGDERLLAPYRGKRISVFPFETDPAALLAVAASGELSPFELYAEVAR